jgi:hypothetical protein
MTSGSLPTVPGDPGVVREASQRLLLATRRLADTETRLRSVGRVDGLWAGEAALAFAGRLGPLPGQVSAAVGAVDEAARALAAYGEELEAVQHALRRRRAEHDALEREVDLSRSRLEAARRRVASAVDVEAELAGHEVVAAARTVAASEDRLLGSARAVVALVEQHDQAVTRLIRVLAAVGAEAPPEPGVLVMLRDAVARGRSEIRSRVEAFVAEHLVLVTVVADYCGTASAVLGLLALAVPALLPASAVLGGIALACTAGLALAGEAGWRDVAVAGVGLVSFGAGSAIARLVARTDAAAASAAGALAGTWSATRSGMRPAGRVAPSGVATAARQARLVAFDAAESRASVAMALQSQERVLTATSDVHTVASAVASEPQRRRERERAASVVVRDYRAIGAELRALVGRGLPLIGQPITPPVVSGG